MTPGDFEVRKFGGYSVNPWRIVHTPTDRVVTIPRALTNGDGETVAFRGAASFPRKRDALAWMRDELPPLLLQAATPPSAEQSTP